MSDDIGATPLGLSLDQVGNMLRLAAHTERERIVEALRDAGWGTDAYLNDAANFVESLPDFNAEPSE